MTPGPVAVLIMARAPVVGSVKTRLQPLLGPAGCARLQAALIERTVALALQVAPARTYLALDPPNAPTNLADPDLTGVRVLPQRGADLGARMHAAVVDVASRHRGPIIVIGTDAPTLTAAHLQQAAGRVTAGDGVVLGPALDGGYYLVGLGRPTPELFAIDPALWGGPGVFAATLDAAAAAALRVGLLSPLRDLDTPADAAAFLDDPALPGALADLLVVMAPIEERVT